MPISVFVRLGRIVCRLLPSFAVLAILCVGVVSLTMPEPSQAQSIDPTQLLQSLVQGTGLSTGSIGGSSLGGSSTPSSTTPMTIQPAAPITPSQTPPSRLEQIMSRRANVSLSQFGYDLLGSGRAVTIPQTGGVADNYILGPGDQIVIDFRGQDNSEYTETVDRGGRILVPKLSPINVSGQTLGEFRKQLAADVGKAYVGSQVFAAIGNVRQISVVVAGEVYVPGTRLVTGLSTALDAILLSGGVEKTGSLRNVVLERGGQRFPIDLYSFLTQRGSSATTLLTDGDRIIVPPIGRTVAVTGWARRPGIYELSPGATEISTSSLLALAGGLEVRGRYRLSVLRVENNGSTSMVALAGTGGVIRDSEILFVQPGADYVQQQATLSGGIPLAGQYSVGRASSLAQVLKAPGALGPNPYTLFGMVSRRDPATLQRALIPITPLAVIHGSENMSLLSDDIVRVFSYDENRLMTAVVDAFVLRRQVAAQELRAPSAGAGNLFTATPALSTTSNGLTTVSAPTSATLDQPSATPSTPNTERQDIAQLSVQTLGDGGLLTNNSPSNGYQPYSSVPPQPQQNQSQQTIISPQSLLTGTTTGSSGQQTPQVVSLPSQVQQQSAPGPQPMNSQDVPANLQMQQVMAGEVPTNETAQTFGQLARQLDVDPLVLVHFLMDRSLTIDGAVQGPGTFLVGPNVSLQDLVSASGGALGWVDARNVELVSTTIDAASGTAQTSHRLLALNDPSGSNTLLMPHDEVRLHQIDTVVGVGSVTLQGQVRYPGTYQFQRGERLSELLLRAGGLTDVAYPYGTVFLRKSAAAIEQASYVRSAHELEEAVSEAVTAVGGDKTPPDALSEMEGVINDLRHTIPLGRISVLADPAVLASDPSRDVLLEDGDVIYIPQRSTTISVMGEVLQPGAFPVAPGMTVKDYLARAGGYNQFANDSMTFLVLPDGSAHQVDSSWLNFDNPEIPPGSTIVVPRDAQILSTRQLVLDIATVFQNLAVGAASLAVINSK